MSRIQHILEKAEREGAALRTSRVGAVTVPISIEIPAPSAPDSAIVNAATVRADATPVIATPAGDLEQFTVRLNPFLVAGLLPKSPAAEQYRALRTRLLHMEGAHAMRTFLITSPQKGEGKSVTSANLALTMAQELHRNVALVEADLRKPSLQHLFGLPPGPGLADYLAGAIDLNGAMKYLPDYHLTVIPGGTTPTNPAELLGSTAMRRMLDQLRTRFDRVILDSPPILPLADVAVLAPMIDGTLLVVRAGFTPKPASENALRAFDSARLLGVVLNESGREQDYRYDSPKH
jgi:capsular exopolysaccharide synthesis family protein